MMGLIAIENASTATHNCWPQQDLSAALMTLLMLPHANRSDCRTDIGSVTATYVDIFVACDSVELAVVNVTDHGKAVIKHLCSYIDILPNHLHGELSRWQ